LDTGFTDHLRLPGRIIEKLSLPQDDYEVVLLAGGNIAQFSVHEVTVIWDDEERIVPAFGADGDVLIGVQLMRESLIILEAIAGDAVTIEAGA
jgi:predicted aspartyl protease